MAPIGSGSRRATMWISIVLFALPVVASYNVLILMSLGSRSHKNSFDPIAEELGRRGHQVTIYSSIKEKTSPIGVENVLMQASGLLQGGLSNVNFFNSTANLMSFSFLVYVHQFVCQILNFTYTDPFIEDLIRNPRRIDTSPTDDTTTSSSRPRYDVVIVNAVFNEFNLPIAHHIGAPVVLVSPTMLFPMLSWPLDIPNPVYVPGLMVSMDSPDHMTFWQRAFSTAANFFFKQLHSQLYLPSLDWHVRTFLPDAPSISELLKNVSFVMSNSHPTIHSSSPTMPYYAQVGGLHCRPAKKLPKDLEDFMQSSGDDGVIYFSFGSIQKGETVPEEMKAKFLEVFRKLPQKVLWKYEADMPDIPSNVKLVAWAPQQDILGHPKLRLFISHAGGLSIQETIYHGKPVIAFPLGAEQLSNVGNGVRLGLAERMDWKTFSTDDLLRTIQKMLADRRYKENALKVSSRFRDRLQHPAEEAAYWIEYVVRHGGARHLKSGAASLNFFQYFLLDVIAAIVTVISIVLIVLAFVLRKLIRYVRNHRVERVVKDSLRKQRKVNASKSKIN